jgi:hypothetical protein
MVVLAGAGPSRAKSSQKFGRYRVVQSEAVCGGRGGT